jgi:hypothetical protein
MLASLLKYFDCIKSKWLTQKELSPYPSLRLPQALGATDEDTTHRVLILGIPSFGPGRSVLEGRVKAHKAY